MLDWKIMVEITPFLLKGAVVTIQLSVAVILIATPLALLAAIGLRSPWRLLSTPLAVVSVVARGLPPLIFLFAAYFVLPQFGLPIDSFTASCVGLTVYIVFYFAEAIRSGLIGIDPGQQQAIDALGLPPVRSFFRIILPQALPAALPSYIGYATEVVKSSALAATIALPELMGNANQMVQSTNRPFEVLIVASLVYLTLDGVLVALQTILERRERRRKLVR